MGREEGAVGDGLMNGSAEVRECRRLNCDCTLGGGGNWVRETRGLLGGAGDEGG